MSRGREGFGSRRVEEEELRKRRWLRSRSGTEVGGEEVGEEEVRVRRR